MKFKNNLEPIIAHLVLGTLAAYNLMFYDSWQPSTELPSSWRAGALETWIGEHFGKGISTTNNHLLNS
jgi:hypothetical protein